MGFISIMNKTLFLWLFFSGLLGSCSFKKDKLPEDSVATINTIAVIIDDQLWKGEVGDSIRNKFASPVLGLRPGLSNFFLGLFHIPYSSICYVRHIPRQLTTSKIHNSV